MRALCPNEILILSSLLFVLVLGRFASSACVCVCVCVHNVFRVYIIVCLTRSLNDRCSTPVLLLQGMCWNLHSRSVCLCVCALLNFGSPVLFELPLLHPPAPSSLLLSLVLFPQSLGGTQAGQGAGYEF